VFINTFKDIYEDQYLQVEAYALEHFIALNFVFVNENPKQKVRFIRNNDGANESHALQAIANNISISQVAENLFVQKDIKGFEENSFYIIKPNEYKCWHRAMAWYDVSEVKEQIQASELKRLKIIDTDGV
jgi:hypothetical protein